jgi:hypothetical protein
MKTLIIALTLALSSQAFAAATAAQYKSIIQGIDAKFDRNWQSLNPYGAPDPGALMTLETFLTAFKSYKIVKPGNYSFTNGQTQADGTFAACSGPASSSCSYVKVVMQPNSHSMTLFGASTVFTYDVIAWMDSGSGYARFLQGSFTPGNPGKGNLTLISCSGCATIGHSRLEWDGTGTTYHLRTNMYDTRFKTGMPEVYGNCILDALYNPGTGDVKIVAAATNVCQSAQTAGDSTCSVANDNAAGYSALVHGNMLTGQVFIWGAWGTNTSSVTPTNTAQQMCLKSDGTQDTATPSSCTTGGVDSFSGMTAYSPSQTPSAWTSATWPFSDITDTPTF